MDQRIVTALIAVIGVPVVLVGYINLGERLLERLPKRTAQRMRPYLWVFPAVAFATVFMVLPTINTFIISFQNAKGAWVGFDNYVFFFTNPDTIGALKNNVLWLIFFTGFVVLFGLLISVLFDRVRYESIAKTAVFLPLPISAVAASIIWKFMYEYQPPGHVQTGTLNAFIGTLGFEPIAWLVNSSTNNPALIFIGVWTSTSFAMVIISAALKVFDTVFTLTNGAYGTDVIARQLFARIANSDYGRAAAVGVVLLLAVTPILVFNIRRFREQEEVR